VRSSDIFPSKFLRAADLNGHAPIVTIERAELRTVGDGEKLVVYFEGKEKGLVLNRTNFSAISELTGEDDTDRWPGHKIKLVIAKVDFQGRRWPAIRIEEPER